MAIATKDVVPVDGKFVCPECHKPFNDRAHLGIHRRVHGISGASKNAINMRRISTAGKQSIAAAQKRRWAKFRAQKASGHGPRPTTSPALVAKMHKLAAKGLRPHAIAEKLGTSPSNVYKHLQAGKVSGNRPTNITDSEIDTVRRMRADGKTREAIAEAIGRSTSSVDRALVGYSVNGRGHGNTLAPRAIAKIKELHAQGLSKSEISRITGSKYGTITRYINQTEEVPANGSNGTGHTETAEDDAAFNQSLIYCYARLEKEAQIYAEGTGVPYSLLATGLADLFRLSSRGQVMGMPGRMPALQRKTS